MTDGREKRIANDTAMVFMGRTMERLFGKASVDNLVRDRNAQTEAAWREKALREGERKPGDLLCLFNKDAHEYEVLRNDEHCLEVKVTRCVHAEVFRSYNAAELGEKLICSGDHAVVAGYNPKMTLTRPATCMTGDCCHFKFEVERPDGS